MVKANCQGSCSCILLAGYPGLRLADDRTLFARRLIEAIDEGHCGLPLTQLVPMAVRLLEVPPEIIETALDLELQDGEVVVDTVDSERSIFSPELFLCADSRSSQAIT